MPHPLTLLQISGRGYPPAPSAEHLADHRCPGRVPQRRLSLPGLDAAAAEIGVLVQAARANGTPIVHVRHLGIQGGLFDPQGRAASSSRNCNRKPGKVVEKRLPNAFSGTELHDLLQNHGRLDLIVCGFMTHSSVSTTVRAARTTATAAPRRQRLRHPRHTHPERRGPERRGPATRRDRRPRRQLRGDRRPGPGPALTAHPAALPPRPARPAGPWLAAKTSGARFAHGSRESGNPAGRFRS